MTREQIPVADLIEAQQRELRVKDLTIGQMVNDMAAAQKRIDDLERRLKSEERLSFRHQLEESQAREALQQKRIDELLNKLDRRNEMLTKSSTRWQDMQRQLAASQAQLKVMLDALVLTQDQAIKDRIFPATASPSAWFNAVCIALAQPTDTTALRELLKAEREKCAKVIERLISGDGVCADDGVWIHDCAEAIRAMEDQ